MNGRTDPIGRLAAAMAVQAARERERTPRPITEAIVEELQSIYRRYIEPCPFRPAQLVTPQRGRPLKGAGEPHIVLEVFDPPIRRPNGEPGTSEEIARIDMRVACLMGDRYSAFAAESWLYEPWDPAAKDAD